MIYISPYNSFRFAKRENGALPNYDNTLHNNRKQIGLKPIQYCQLIVKTEERTIQIRSDYDAITAVIRDNSDNSEAVVVVNVKAVYTSFSTWELNYTFNVNGNYSFIVTGTDSEQPTVIFESEPISVKDKHLNTLLVEYYNDTNTPYVDYSTEIKHWIRVVSRIPDGAEDTDQDVYDNQNRKQKTYSATTFNGEFKTGAIPDYQARQLELAQGLFFLFVNNKRFTGIETTAERFGSSTMKQATIICSEYETPGVNSDDSGNVLEPIPDDMQNIYPLNLLSVSGAQEFTIPADFMPDTIIAVLTQGVSGTVKVGTIVGGSNVVSITTLNAGRPVLTVDREYLKELAQYRNSFKLYFTITGVSVQMNLTTIVKKY